MRSISSSAVKHLIEWVKAKKIKPEKQVEPAARRVSPFMDVLTWAGRSITSLKRLMKVRSNSISRQPKKIRVRDGYPVQINDMPIPASRKLSAVFLRLIPTFELKAVKPYDPRYLSNWPAEVYDIPMAEASLDARSPKLVTLQT